MSARALESSALPQSLQVAVLRKQNDAIERFKEGHPDLTKMGDAPRTEFPKWGSKPSCRRVAGGEPTRAWASGKHVNSRETRMIVRVYNSRPIGSAMAHSVKARFGAGDKEA